MEEATKFTHVWLKNCTGRVVNVEGNIEMNIRKISREVVRICMWGQGRTYCSCPSRKVSSQSLDTKLRLTLYMCTHYITMLGNETCRKAFLSIDVLCAIQVSDFGLPYTVWRSGACS